jgi:hypothetical protein
MKIMHTKFIQKRRRENRSNAKPLRALGALPGTQGVNLVKKTWTSWTSWTPCTNARGILQVSKRAQGGHVDALGGDRKSEIGSQKSGVRRRESENRRQNGEEAVRKSVAVLGCVAALEESSGNLEVLRPPQHRQVAALGWARIRDGALQCRRTAQAGRRSLLACPLSPEYL